MTATSPEPPASPPMTYNALAPSEQATALPSGQATPLALPGLALQPPLSRRGTGPGIIVVLPPKLSLRPHAKLGLRPPLDPDPVLKWAEEGFNVVGAQLGANTDVSEALAVALAALEECPSVDAVGKYGVLVYDPSALEAVLAGMATQPSLVCLISHGSAPSYAPVPALAHVPGRIGSDSDDSNESLCKVYAYEADSAYFVVPSAGPKAYSPLDASIVHTRSLVFLRNHLGGPYFDLESIWDEHTYCEFRDRSVAKTMATMVAEPYVNHIPTMTGGMGREALTAFYRDHFIFSNPADAELVVVSRTIGADRVVEEFVYNCTHDRVIDWLLPGVPPSGKKLEIPMMAVVNIRGDRLYHEHIWWDQACALKQAGYLPAYVPINGGEVLRLPVAGPESAHLLMDETSGESNEMMGPEWGVQKQGSTGANGPGSGANGTGSSE